MNGNVGQMQTCGKCTNVIIFVSLMMSSNNAVVATPIIAGWQPILIMILFCVCLSNDDIWSTGW